MPADGVELTPSRNLMTPAEVERLVSSGSFCFFFGETLRCNINASETWFCCLLWYLLAAPAQFMFVPPQLLLRARPHCHHNTTSTLSPFLHLLLATLGTTAR
jgi:hypothetical protein